MQHLNDDMDELFREAAKDYSLLLEEEDFDSIAAKLLKADVRVVGIEDKKSRKNKSALLLVAFLLLLVPGAFVLFSSNINSKAGTSAGLQSMVKAFNEENNKANKEKISAVNNPTTASVSSLKNNISNFLQGAQPSKLRKNILLADGSKMNKLLAQADVNQPIETQKALEEKYSTEEVSNTISKPPSVITRNKISDPGNASFNKIKADATSQLIAIKKQQPIIKQEKRFYIGFVAGPQFNQVKSQGYGSPRISAGLIAGMHLNKKLSIETGLLIAFKKYYSSGEYFNMSKVAATMPSGMKLISMSGKSTVLEMPIVLKYEFVKKNNASVFGTSGLSSYFLKKESNDYLATVNGNKEKLTGNYSRNQKYFMAALNISAGYEYKTGKGASVRVEPYIQIPIKGIGVGSMPVSSAGARLGISFPAFK